MQYINSIGAIYRPDRENAEILKISSGNNKAAQKDNETLIKLELVA